jgi:hypothetical protein
MYKSIAAFFEKSLKGRSVKMNSKLRGAATLAAVFSASLLAASAALAVESDEVPASFMANVKPHTTRGASRSDGTGTGTGSRFSNNTLGVDSVQNFSGYFYEPGATLNFVQFTWPYTMVGRAPSRDGDSTTVIDAPIVPVIIDLRNSDGSPRYYPGPKGPVRMILDPTANVGTVLNSPSFTPASYGDKPAQFTDGLFRAQFKGLASGEWHTLLNPSVKTTRTMVLIRGTYRFSVDATGHLRYVLVDAGTFANNLFPPGLGDTTTVMGQAETAGEVTQKGISTFLFQDTYLYNNGDPNQCCILGYHSYDLEPGDASNGWRERRYVMNYSSYISPGIFGGGLQDVTAISHELSETFDDPFVGNATPIWLAPNGNCQNDLETGDVIEGLPNAIFTVKSKGFSYHLQNEALLEWFAGASAAPKLNGAYSWPDSTVLPAPAQLVYPDCATPFVF